MSANSHLIPPDRWEDHESSLTLYPPSGFSIEHTLGYLTRSSNECMFHVEHGSIYKLIQAGQSLALVQVSGGPDETIRIRFMDEAAALQPGERAAVADYVWEWLDLGVDLEPFYKLSEQDPLLSVVVPQFRGLHIVGIPDLFEALSWGIIGQQINLAFAYTLKRRFVEAFGQSVVWNGRAYWLFPEPESIARLSVSDLTPLQFTGKKAEYIIGVAEKISEGSLSKQQLLDIGEPKAIEKELVSIRGIGPWTANYVLMRCLRAPSAFPIADVGLHNAVKHVLGLETKPSIEQLKQFSAPWGEWKAYATFYLWRTLY
ncbi:DNA-3-methyladenine glycosylase family protein [Paenibacillus sp. NPDC056579]|uniref:DNA-3-methyladenine glycosylase family protein n=1 Tax=unclassified Paenibacillus TaxID=185978 RepID=UPI001EF929B2|nr:DNA-3-methyladenine glycosylase [Paenibacillus sp. H1-7]ULL18121.1 DNA-3-methyladenine glycosylase 2 family protein [Paenibacillus sp. H1-7]